MKSLLKQFQLFIALLAMVSLFETRCICSIVYPSDSKAVTTASPTDTPPASPCCHSETSSSTTSPCHSSSDHSRSHSCCPGWFYYLKAGDQVGEINTLSLLSYGPYLPSLIQGMQSSLEDYSTYNAHALELFFDHSPGTFSVLRL